DRIDSLTIQLVKIFDGEIAPAEPDIGSTLPYADEPINILNPSMKEVATETLEPTEHECLSHIRQERDGLKAQCLELEQCINRMQDELRELEKLKHTNGSLKSMLKRETWKVTTLQASKQNVEKALNQLTQENQLLKSQLADLSAQCDESRRNAEEAQAVADQSNIKLARWQQLCDELQEALNRSKTQLEAKAASEQQLRRSIEDLSREKEGEKTTLLKNNEAEKKRNTDLVARLKVQEEALRQFRQAKTSLESELGRMTQSIEELETAKRSLQQTTQKLRKENQMLQSQLQMLNNSKKVSEQKFEKLSKDLVQKTTLERQLNHTIAALHERLNRHAEESDNRLKEAKRIQNELYGKVCEHQNLRQKCEKELVALKVQLERNKHVRFLLRGGAEHRRQRVIGPAEDSTSYQHRRQRVIGPAEDSTSIAVSESSVLLRTVPASRPYADEPINILNPSMKEVATETLEPTEHECLSHIRQERDGLKAQCLELEQCINRMQDELRELEKLKHTNGSLKSMLKRETWKVTTLQASKQNVEKALNQLTQENQLLKSQLADLSAQFKESRKNAEEAQAMTEQSNAKLADSQHLCDALQEALNHSKTQLEAKAASEQQRRREFEGLSSEREREKTLLKSNQALNKRNTDLVDRLKEQDETLHQSRQAKTSLESELDFKTLAMEELKTAKQSLQETAQKLTEEKQMLQSQLETLSDVNKVFERKLEELRKKFNSLLTDFEKKDEALNNAKKMKESLETAVKEKTLALIEQKKSEKRIQAELMQARWVAGALENRFAALRTEFEVQTRSLNESKESILLLKTQLKDKDSVLAELEVRRQNLHRDMTQERLEKQKLSFMHRWLQSSYNSSYNSEEAVQQLQAKNENMAQRNHELQADLNKVTESLTQKTALERQLNHTIAVLHERLNRHAKESDNRLKEAKRVQNELYGKVCQHQNLRQKCEKELVA
uniref:Coiled-coil domain-containing protein 150 n=1 Tax=Macrostomum lignano TaxID=282301 RepID=A0A1I8G9K9_9PLAT